MDEQICKLTALLNKMLLREARDLLMKIGNPKRFAKNMTRVWKLRVWSKSLRNKNSLVELGLSMSCTV